MANLALGSTLITDHTKIYTLHEGAAMPYGSFHEHDVV